MLPTRFMARFDNLHKNDGNIFAVKTASRQQACDAVMLIFLTVAAMSFSLLVQMFCHSEVAWKSYPPPPPFVLPFPSFAWSPFHRELE